MRNREMQRELKWKQLHILEAAWTYLYEFVAIVQHFFDKKMAPTQKFFLRLGAAPAILTI